MANIEAKSVVDDYFWILQKNNKKIGEVIQVHTGKYEVNILGERTEFTTLELLKQSPMFTFIDLPGDKPLTEEVEGYPTDTIAHNKVWNIKHNLPLYTQSDDSKSWHAAGYYKVLIHSNWIVQFCPKLISLNRYEFEGPFKSDPKLKNFSRIFE